VHVPGWSVPWILSNPIEVFSGVREAERRLRAAWPAASPPPVAAERLEESSFHAEFDSASFVEEGTLAPTEGPEGGPALRLAFRLGSTSPQHPFVSCALVSRDARDLTGRQGLVFSIKGDGVYRAWVQVRDLNPSSADDGTEWWFASVRTSRSWTRMALPFARLRSINPKSDGRLDLDKVRMIALVVDAGAAAPGTKGRIFLADLGVY
jgi:Carbohydrate binding domain (family 11)